MPYPTASRFRPSLLVLALGLAGGVQAAPLQSLKTVKVKAEAEVPGKTVSAERLKKTQAGDLRESLAAAPGVGVGGGASPVAQKIYVRGLEDALLRISVDGVTQSGNVFHHQGRLNLEPGLLKRIELDKGSTAASAGPGALAGALRVETKDAGDLLAAGQALGGQLGLSRHSNHGEKQQAAVYGRSAWGEALLAGSRGRMDAAEDGRGKPVATSAADQDSALAKLKARLGHGQELSLSYRSHEDEGLRYLRANMGGFSRSGPLLPQRLNQDSLRLAWRLAESGARPALELSWYDDALENRRLASGRSFGERIESRGGHLAAESRLGEQVVRYGLNLERQEASAINPARLGAGGNTGREDAEVLGAYVEDAIPLGESWLLGLGARYDRYGYQDNFGVEIDGDGFSPSASLNFQASEALELELAYARSFRGVGLKEAYFLDNGPGPFLYRTDPKAEGERARQAQFSARYAQAAWRFEASVFRQRLDDYLTGDVLPGAGALRFNDGTMRNRGYELSGAWRGEALGLRAGLSYSQPELDGRPLRDGDWGLGTRQGRSWLAGLDYRFDDLGLDLAWELRLVQSLAYRSADVAIAKDGYTVHDLYLNWQPDADGAWSLALAARNLGDRFYHDHASFGVQPGGGQILGLAEPGRDLRLSLNLRF